MRYFSQLPMKIFEEWEIGWICVVGVHVMYRLSRNFDWWSCSIRCTKSCFSIKSVSWKVYSPRLHSNPFHFSLGIPLNHQRVSLENLNYWILINLKFLNSDLYCDLFCCSPSLMKSHRRLNSRWMFHQSVYLSHHKGRMVKLIISAWGTTSNHLRMRTEHDFTSKDMVRTGSLKHVFIL